jgi:NAD(P)-dependent dehydrogenase (short-subunit alcohol dehydrogenase family)
MGNKLEGKIAVITGGTSGIGLATAKRFVSDGAYVFITGLYQKEVDVAVSDIGKNVSGIQSDVSNLADLDKLYDVVKDQKGHIDIYLQMRVLFNSLHWEKSLRNTSTKYSALM